MPRRKPSRRSHEPAQAGPIKTWGKTAPGMHVPVLAREVVERLCPRPGQVVVDCTVGYGGHSWLLAQRVAPDGRLIGLDMDERELGRTRERLTVAPAAVSLHHANFSQLAEVLGREGVEKVDIILADLGVSSMQVDDESRGISYKHANAPLDMRLSAGLQGTAAQLLAEISQQALADALSELADEPDAAKIAQWIVSQRQVSAIETTGQLSRLVMNAKGLTDKTWRESRQTRFGELHPAARTFQALRILVNDELGSLRSLLATAPAVLASGGRIGIISFHSGEDRPVKQAFRDGLESGLYSAISPKAIVPRPAEVRANPRSASAKFRWAQRA